MFTISGKFNTAKVFTDNVDEKNISLIIAMLNEYITKDTVVRIMPDTHYGKRVPIGTTIKLPDNRTLWKVCPSVVSGDIGCGMMSYKINTQHIDLEKLDAVINKHIPAGPNLQTKPKDRNFTQKILKESIMDHREIDLTELDYSLGTLGGGNHFIELAKGKNNEIWLTVHTGSRHFGQSVNRHYQKKANTHYSDWYMNKILAYVKEKGTPLMTQDVMKNINPREVLINMDYAYLTDTLLLDYLHDLELAQKFAIYNRKVILDTISQHMDFDIIDQFDSIHNYIDLEHGIIRKGATSAQKGQRLIIPLNMRDGSLICEGKGNQDWNFSAPHGAGRQFSRSEMKKRTKLDEFTNQMQGIYSTSVTPQTLDEAPDAYKPYQEIINNITDTVTIIDHIKPLYNFKAH